MELFSFKDLQNLKTNNKDVLCAGLLASPVFYEYIKETLRSQTIVGLLPVSLQYAGYSDLEDGGVLEPHQAQAQPRVL